MDDMIKEYFSFLGKKGGAVRSTRKTESCRKNALKGREAIQKRIQEKENNE